ncbi:MAG: NmrA/HSCARG family protein [Thermoplasmata archaeon]
MSGPTRPSVRSAAKSLLVLVTGISGNQGSHLAQQLLARGHRIRALVRNPQHPMLETFRSKRVDVVQGNFEDQASIQQAARGIDAMFLMSTSIQSGPEAETRQAISAIEAAKGVGVPWLVYSSVGDANRRTGIPHFDSKFAVEEHLARSGISYAVTAPTSFMENFLAPFQMASIRQGKLVQAISPDRPIQMVALDDLSAFVCHVIENPFQFQRKRINVASDSSSGTESARILSEVSGRKIQFQQLPIEALRSQNVDLAKMFEWLERVGYTADIEGLRREYPTVGWQRLRGWATRIDWNRGPS